MLYLMNDPLRDLNPNQFEAVKHINGPLLITAGAGSGKTKTLTSRLFFLLSQGIPGREIVAITFTNKAAEEMKRRATTNFINQQSVSKASAYEENSLPFIGTFHSFGARILRTEAGAFDRNRSFSIFDENDAVKLIKQLLKNGDFDKTQYPFGMVRKNISQAKGELTPFFADERLEYLYNQYELELKKHNAFDFDDLIEKPVRLLELFAQKLASYQDRFRYFLVDEYQDVNTAQYRLIKLLSDKEKNLSVVGDDHQSIYSFRSADFRNFLNFERDFPNAKIVVLNQNYRSTKNIVAASSAVINHNKNQRPKTLWTNNEEGSLIHIQGFYSAEREAEWLIENIGNTRNTAVLYRTNAQSRPIEQACVFNKIPYFIYGGLKFYDRKEIKDIVSAMRYAVNPADELSKERLLKEFKKTRVRPIIDSLPEMASSLSPVEFIGYLLKKTDYLESLKSDKSFEDRKENIGELISFAGGFVSVAELVERVSLLESTDQPKSIGDTSQNNTFSQNKDSSQKENIPLRLMTIHMAKGLEFDNVFLVGASESILPHERSIFKADDLEEERRLMYVAMTRAKKKLSISFFRNASRFLYEIPPELVVFANSKFSFSDEDAMYLD